MKITDLKDILNIDENAIVVILGIIILILKQYNSTLILNIIITTFIVAIFDLYLKQILLFSQNDDYYIFIINNIITIITINFFIYLMRDLYEKITFSNFFYIAFACFFYETIVFKLFNYNNMCNNRLRKMTKTLMRLATIHILGSYLNGEELDKKWFDYSFAQLINFSLFNIIFE